MKRFNDIIKVGFQILRTVQLW